MSNATPMETVSKVPPVLKDVKCERCHSTTLHQQRADGTMECLECIARRGDPARGPYGGSRSSSWMVRVIMLGAVVVGTIYVAFLVRGRAADLGVDVSWFKALAIAPAFAVAMVVDAMGWTEPVSAMVQTHMGLALMLSAGFCSYFGNGFWERFLGSSGASAASAGLGGASTSPSDSILTRRGNDLIVVAQLPWPRRGITGRCRRGRCSAGRLQPPRSGTRRRASPRTDTTSHRRHSRSIVRDALVPRAA